MSDTELILSLKHIPAGSFSFLVSAFEYLRKFEKEDRTLSVVSQREKIFGYVVALYQFDKINGNEYNRLYDAIYKKL